MTAKIHRAMSFGRIPKSIDFVTAVGQITKDQFAFWKLGLDQRFQPAKMLHPFSHGATDDTNVVPFAGFPFRLCLSGGDQR
jgi:hypothetical protein